MNLRLFYILLSSAMITSSCSVYKSTGRKSFESKSSGNLTTGVSTQQNDENSNWNSGDASEDETCWNQPSSDPLWHIDAEHSLTVQKITDDEIQVCLQAL